MTLNYFKLNQLQEFKNNKIVITLLANEKGSAFQYFFVFSCFEWSRRSAILRRQAKVTVTPKRIYSKAEFVLYGDATLLQDQKTYL